MGRAGKGRWGLGVLLTAALGCGQIAGFAQGIEGPSEVVGHDQQWFLDNVGVPCAKERSLVGGEVWLYAQVDQGVDLLDCDTPGVRRSWGIYFMGSVCTAAMSLDRPPR